MLLYPQARQSIDVNSIPMREKRRHKTSSKGKKKSQTNASDTSYNSSERSELERQDAFELPTDSESEEDEEISTEEEFDDCQSDAFEYVNMYKNRRNSVYDFTGTFIDYGDAVKTPPKPCLRSSINLIKLSTNDSVDGPALKKQSLIIGSKAMQALARKSTESSTVIHTSTAQLKLDSEGTIVADVDSKRDPGKLSIMPQQTSETSHGSSVYDGRGMGDVYLACENLNDLADEMKVKKALAASPPERHSMPNIFVGNRFNRTPNTAVYLPSWKDRNEMQKQSVEDEIHTSSLDLPAVCLVAPDKLQAELLYNFNGSLHNSQENIISPPSLYKQAENSPDQLNNSTRSSTLSEKKAAENQKSESTAALRSNSLTQDPSSALRRCISYQYIQMSNNAEISDAQPTNVNKATRIPTNRNQQEQGEDHRNEYKCRCCESSQCPSPRSSDSGMAGSCTIASPDPPNPDAAYYYGGVGGLQLDAIDQIDSTHFDVCGNFREKFLIPTTTSNNKATAVAAAAATSTSTATTTAIVPLEVHTKSIVHSPVTKSSILFSSSDNPSAETANAGMFRSGMYAHWWKKEKLPADVIHGITLATRAANKLQPHSAQSSQDSHCSICSSCQCSFSISGFSEGTKYCSLCQDCMAYASLVAEAQPANTATTNTSSFSCPLCSADDMNVSGNMTSAVMTTSSASSSLDCPICSRLLEAHNMMGSLSSTESVAKAAAVKGKQK